MILIPQEPWSGSEVKSEHGYITSVSCPHDGFNVVVEDRRHPKAIDQSQIFHLVPKAPMSPVSTCSSCSNRYCRAASQAKPNMCYEYEQQVCQCPEKSHASSKQYSIERYNNQKDQHKAFLVGASSSRSALDTRRELNQWEKDWQRMGGNQPGSKGF